MPSNFTEHYNLSQWEKTDKILMEDFNADNAKLDAALACHPSAELICAATVEDETATRVGLDVSQVDWSRYFMLYLSVHKDTRGSLTITTNQGDCHSMRLFNGGANNENSMSYFYEAMDVRALFFVGYSGSTAPVLLGVSTCQATGNFPVRFQVNTGFASIPYQEFSELYVGGSKLGVGAKVELWGIK